MTVDKFRIRYLDTGSSGKGNKAKSSSSHSILLIHGLGGSIESWSSNINKISQAFRIIAVDLPGFGLSDKPKISYTISFYKEFISNFVKKVGIGDKLSIIGSSLGGHIAAEFALNYPNRVSRLVLISPAGALPRYFKGTPALREYVRILRANTSEQIKQILFAVGNKPVDDGYTRTVYQRLSIPGAKEAFISALIGSAKAPRLTNRLNRIKANTVVIWGKEDRMIPMKFVEPFIKMKNSSVILLDRCGHTPHVDRPAIFNQIVMDFLKE